MTDHKELLRKLREADHVATSDDTGAFRFNDKLAGEAADFIQSLIQVAGEAYRRVSDLEHEARKRAESDKAAATVSWRLDPETHAYLKNQAVRYGIESHEMGTVAAASKVMFAGTKFDASQAMMATAMFGDVRENGNG